MAKLKAPLLSFGASGAVGKSIVLFPWKGLDAVREYVVPANPNTLAQSTQRGYMKNCVIKLHAAMLRASHAFDALDKSAYARVAALYATPRTWFNAVVKLWVDCKVDTKVPVIYSDHDMEATAATGARCIAYLNEETGSSLAAGNWYIGLDPASMYTSKPATIFAGNYVGQTVANQFTGLTVGTRYYVQFKPAVGDPCEGANSGIHSFIAT